MGLSASDKGNGKDFDPIPEGIHPALCYQVIDLGMQFSEKWGKSSHKCLIGWELPEVRMEIDRDGEKLDLPKVISKIYTVSLHQKASLRKDLETWRSRSFTEQDLKGWDLKKVLGVPCELQILHAVVNDRTYSNVSLILPAKFKAKETENPQRFFSFEDGGEPPEELPDWILDIIHKSDEWLARQDAPPPTEYEEHPDVSSGDDSDIPF